jgi:hypothetical protein
MHNEELHNLYSSPDIIRQIKSRRKRWAGHVARMGEERKLYKVLGGKPEGRDHSEDQWDQNGSRGDWLGGVYWIRLSHDRVRLWAVCECGDEPSGSCATELVTCEVLCRIGGLMKAFLPTFALKSSKKCFMSYLGN